MLVGAGSRRVVAGLCLAALLGCSESDDRCPEGGEFANDGCARIAGVIRSPTGTPLGGVLVSVRPRADDPADYTTPSTTTGASGRFDLELFRLASEGPPRSRAGLYLRMTLVREAPVMDSVLADVEFAPVGELTRTTEVAAVFDTLAASARVDP